MSKPVDPTPEEAAVQAQEESKFLTQWSGQLDERIERLEPFAREYERLLKVRTRVQGVLNGTSARGGPGRPPGSATGKRAEEALRLITARPGITVEQMAAEMGIGTTYLYRVCPQMEREGKIVKDGTGYKPVDPGLAAEVAAAQPGADE